MMKAFLSTTVLFLSLVLVSTACLAQSKSETVVDPKADTPEGTVAAALRAGIANDFNAYMATIHPDHKKVKKQVDQRHRYEWKRFSKQAQWYVKSRTPFTIEVTRRDPQGEVQYRIILKDQTKPNRMPVPVRLKKSGNTWKIVTNSL